MARMLAIVDTCMYDAWTAYDSTAVPTRANGITKRPPADATDADKIKAISYAVYRAEVDLFPTDTANANVLMAALGLDPTDTSTDTSTAVGIGNVAAAAVISFRHHDGANQLGDVSGGTPYSDYTFYAPVNTPDQIIDPNRWQPLRVSNGMGGFVVQQFIAPFWGNVTPFSPLPPFTGHGPDFYPSQEYAREVDRILDYSADLTDRQKVIAEYWKDGPKSELPPGHWGLFTEFVSRRDKHGIDDDVKMFFAQSNAILDASIASWGIKRFYVFRPTDHSRAFS